MMLAVYDIYLPGNYIIYTNIPSQKDYLKFVSFSKGGIYVIVWVVPLPRMLVTTRIIIVLVGYPELNLHLPLESWEGGQPKF